MQRRSFIRLAALGSAAGVIAPSTVLAGMSHKGMAGNVFYTKDAPGRWSKKVAGHLPNISTEVKDSKLQVQVVTSHEMKGFEHYIIKHVVMDKDFNFLSETLFNPEKDKAPISTHDLGEYRGQLYVTSMCNLHDVWLNTAEA